MTQAPPRPDHALERALASMLRARPACGLAHFKTLIFDEEKAMQAFVGPVLTTRDGGYSFDSWTPETGLSRSYAYRRVEDAYYARKAEIRSQKMALAS